MSGTIIAVITGLAFVSMGIWLATVGRRIRFPKGKREEFRVLGHDVIAVSRTGLTPAIREDVARALRALGRAWSSHFHVVSATSLTPKLLHEVVPRFVLHFAERVYRDYEGVQTYASSRIGNRRIPMLVIDDVHMDESGSLIIHEMCHVLASELLGHPDVRHAAPEVWVQLEAMASQLKATAVRHFQDDGGKVGVARVYATGQRSRPVL